MAKVANYKISIELEKLKIYVEGARDIAPEIANNVAQQIATVLQPAGLIEGPSDNGQPINVTHIAPAKRQGRRRSGATRSDPPNGGSVTGHTTRQNGERRCRLGSSGRKSCGFSLS